MNAYVEQKGYLKIVEYLIINDSWNNSLEQRNIKSLRTIGIGVRTREALNGTHKSGAFSMF